MKCWASFLAVWFLAWCLFGTAVTAGSVPLDIALQHVKHETNTDPTFFPRYVSLLVEHHIWRNFSTILRSHEGVEQPFVRDAVLGGLWLYFCLQFLAVSLKELLRGTSEKNKRSRNCLLLALLLSVQRYPTTKLSSSSDAEETQCLAEESVATFYGIAFKVCPSPAFVEIERSNRWTSPSKSYFQQIKSLVAAISWTMSIAGNDNRLPSSGNILPYPFEPQTNKSSVIFVGHDSQEVLNSMPNINKFMSVVPVSQDSLGLQQISDWILKNPTPSSIHIISHGSLGSIALGSVPITTETLLQQDFCSGSSILLTNTDLFIYGCNAAEGETGAVFLETLRSSLGVRTVSASTNQTGSIAKGGDWVLEVVAGDSVPQSSPLMAPDYNGLLAIGTCNIGSFIEVEDGSSTNYPTLQAAFAAINAGTHTGTIVIEVCGNTTEAPVAEAPSVALNASGSGSASYASITIKPVGGAARTISGAAAAAFPLLDLNGADNVTIDGLNSGGNSLTISNTTASSVAGTSTIRFQADATNNTITNTTILGSANMAATTAGGTIWFGSGSVTGNENNTVSFCRIGPAGGNLPSTGISFSGFDNSGNIIDNNEIFDYFNATENSAGIQVSSGTVILQISNNKFYQTASRTITSGVVHWGIHIDYDNGFSYNVSGNTIGYASSSGTGIYTVVLSNSTARFLPIHVISTTGVFSSVQNNTITSIAVSGSAQGTESTSPFIAILIFDGSLNVTNNTIGSLSSTDNITYTSSSPNTSFIYAIYRYPNGNTNISTNSIGGITASNSSTGACNIYGIFINTGISSTVSNNVIGGTIANSIQNTTTSASSAVQGIRIGSADSDITGNTIRNLTAAGGSGTTTDASVGGIVLTSSGFVYTISQNTIYNLKNLNVSANTVVTGIQFITSRGIVERNLIYGLASSTNGLSAEVNGIRIAGGTCTYRNNMIAVGAGVSNAIGVHAIYELAGTNNFYHNSIYVGGNPTAGSGNSFAFRSTETLNTRDYRNNIFMNSRSNSGGASGKNYSITVAGTVPNPAGLTINNNIYYANGTGGVFGLFNGADVTTLSAWKIAVGLDDESIYSDPKYTNPTGTTPDLHLSNSVVTPAEGNGVDVGVVNDFDGETRSSLTPVDIGADAGNFIGQDLIGPSINYSLLSSAVVSATRSFSGVSITDRSGVNTTSGTKPRLYYKKLTDTNDLTPTGWKFVEANGSSSPFDFTIDYSLLSAGSVSNGDGIQYFVMAQDLAATPNIGVNYGVFSVTPSSVALTAAAFPITGTIKQYSILPSISGTKTVCASGCDYTTLTGANGIFNAINNSVLTGNLDIQIAGDLVVGEDGSVALNAIIEQPVGSNFTLRIYPAGGAARTISGAAVAGSALITLNGADNVTIDGLNSGGNSLTISNTRVSNTPGTSTIRFQADATSNTITHCSILGSATMSITTLGGTIYFAAAAVSTGNINNTISNCNIGPAGANLPTKGIYSRGTSLAFPNSGIIISNNAIFDYFGAAASSAGIFLDFASEQITISNNRLYQSATRTMTSGSQHFGICISSSFGIGGHTIAGNTIGFANSSATGSYTLVLASGGSFVPINASVGTTIATSVQGNTIGGIAISGGASGTFSSAPFRAISIGRLGLANVGNLIGNTIGSLSAPGSITYTSSSTSTSDIYGIFNFSDSDTNISNNSIGGITVRNSSTGASKIYGIRVDTTAFATSTITNNIVGGPIPNSLQSTSTAAATSVQGILINSNSIVTGNIIQNLTAAGGTGITTSASIAGIVFAFFNVNHIVSGNTIRNLSNTSTGTATVITGIQFISKTGTNIVERNLIYGLASSSGSASAEVNGIRIADGTCTYRNNMIAVGAGVSNAIGVHAIYEVEGTNNFYHNSIYVGGNPTAGSGNSFAFRSTETLNTRDYRNNIFVNSRSNSGGASGKNYSITVAGTVPNPAGLTIDNNIYYANGTGGVFGLFNGADVTTLSAWQTAVGQDAGSFYNDPLYKNPACIPPDLHLANSTPAEGMGFDVGVVNDFDGETRSSLTPVDIGADAGNFIGSDNLSPQITYPEISKATTANYTFNVVLTDSTGVATGSNAPRLYTKKNGGSYSSTACILFSGTTNNGTWSCTTDYSLVGGVVFGDVISYFIVAQDMLGNLGFKPCTAAGTSVNNVTSPPSSPYTYLIAGTISGTKTVCASGCDFSTLTGGTGVFKAINNSLVSGNLDIQIAGNLIVGEDGSVALNAINEQPAASNYTIKLYPVGAARTIGGTSASSGAFLRLNAADRVTIDGSINGTGSDRSLSVIDAGSAGTGVIYLQNSGADGATNNTIKNLIIRGRSSTASTLGIGIGGNIFGTAGINNRNNTIQNNDIGKVVLGLYCAGDSTSNPNSGNIITKNLLGSPSPNNIGRIGMFVAFEDNIQITQNTIDYISSTSNVDVIGIAAGAQSIATNTNTGAAITNAIIEGNIIGQIQNTNAFSAGGIVLFTDGSGTCRIANNSIYGVIAKGSGVDFGAGIFAIAGSGSTVQAYYNSVSMTGTLTGGNGPNYAIALAGGASGDPVAFDIKNNAFYNTQSTGTGKNYAIGTSSTAFTNLSSNYNDFYVANAANYYVGHTGNLGVSGVDLLTLADWRSATGKDANSISADPLFTSITNLLLTASSPLCSAGTPIAGMTTDILSTTRAVIYPSIGAYECSALRSNTVQVPGGSTATVNNVHAQLNQDLNPGDTTFKIKF